MPVANSENNKQPSLTNAMACVGWCWKKHFGHVELGEILKSLKAVIKRFAGKFIF